MINQDLQELRNTVDQTRQILAEAIVHEQDEKYKPFLNEQIEGLQKALTLSDALTSGHYKVAIVGRFKVGKSSFVNAFCDTKNLASVKATPETAAITIFSYSDKVHAEIKMISKNRWDEMVEIYQTNPSDSEVTRYRNLLKDLEKLSKSSADSKNQPPKQKDLENPSKSNADSKNQPPTILAELEKEYISKHPVIKKLECVDWNDKESRKEFTTQVQKFMSKGDPAHYFVDKVRVYVPVPLLQEGIELIDTPGLDDTDTYRVNLTNEFIKKEADVILYLMRSGDSYAQSDKDFIIEQQYHQTLKHLRFIVTQCDFTFKNAKQDAQNKEEKEPSFDEHIAAEETRLREQLNTTLDELLVKPGVGEDEKLRFRKQLVDIPISFISSRDYFDGSKPESGIGELRKDLEIMLAKSERISDARKILQEANDRIFERTQRTFSERHGAIGQKFDVKQIEQQLLQIDAEIHNTLDEFEKTVKQLVEVFKSRNETDWELVEATITNIVSEAEKVVSKGQEDRDWRAHWKTRRHRSWGNIEPIAKQIANHIFLQVETILRRYRSHLEEDVLSHIKTKLKDLQPIIAKIEQDHGSSTLPSLKLTEIFETKHKSLLSDLDAYITIQNNLISTRLEDFVSSMKAPLEESMKNVTDIRGRGTTAKQDEEVRAFYLQFKNNLTSALKTHLTQQFKKFSSLLEEKSEEIFPVLKGELKSVVDARRKAIEASLVQRNETEKAQLLKYLTTYLNKLREIQSGQVTS